MLPRPIIYASTRKTSESRSDAAGSLTEQKNKEGEVITATNVIQKQSRTNEFQVIFPKYGKPKIFHVCHEKKDPDSSTLLAQILSVTAHDETEMHCGSDLSIACYQAILSTKERIDLYRHLQMLKDGKLDQVCLTLDGTVCVFQEMQPAHQTQAIPMKMNKRRGEKSWKNWRFGKTSLTRIFQRVATLML